MEQFYRQVLSGQDTGAFASLLRGVTRLAEPVYRAIVSSRNASYSRGVLRTIRIEKPVISVGNITTGGTGKTPVVHWLANRFRDRGLNVAILLRGYKATGAVGSDEAELLDRLLNPDPARPRVIVHTNPDRVAGARDVLRDHPKTDVFLLDDGFQHRRIHRDFDLVLIDATNPFGYEHVLPRGLLREPLRNLSRATAFLITRVDQALPDAIPEIEQCLKRQASSVPVYRCNHVHLNLGVAGNQPVFVFSGIGNPDAFERHLRGAGFNVVATRQFGDHHHYTKSDLVSLQSAAKTANATAMITTEKDWVKVAPLLNAEIAIPIHRVQLQIQFMQDDEQKLFDHLLEVVAGVKSSGGL